jgi:retron-type reverse transcriptase
MMNRSAVDKEVAESRSAGHGWKSAETGKWYAGGIISPVLANVYLHYALDLWFERVFQRSCKGGAFLHRYADDFVCGLGRAEEPQRFYNELEERLRKFGLELAPDKTRVKVFKVCCKRS